MSTVTASAIDRSFPLPRFSIRTTPPTRVYAVVGLLSGAIYDRLLIREEVKDIEMAKNFRRVLERTDVPPPKVPMKEIEELWKSAEGVKVSNDVKEALTELREKVHEEGVRSSNRRWFDSVRVLRGKDRVLRMA